MSDHDQPAESAAPEAPAPARETVAFIHPESADAGATVAFTPAAATPAASPPRPPAPPPPPAPPAPPPSFRVAPPPSRAPAPDGRARETTSIVEAEAPPASVGEVMLPGTDATAAAVVQAERAADIAAAGPRPIAAVEPEEPEHRGRNILISILIVLLVAAIVSGIIIVI